MPGKPVKFTWGALILLAAMPLTNVLVRTAPHSWHCLRLDIGTDTEHSGTSLEHGVKMLLLLRAVIEAVSLVSFVAMIGIWSVIVGP